MSTIGGVVFWFNTKYELYPIAALDSEIIYVFIQYIGVY